MGIVMVIGRSKVSWWKPGVVVTERHGQTPRTGAGEGVRPSQFWSSFSRGQPGDLVWGKSGWDRRKCCADKPSDVSHARTDGCVEFSMAANRALWVQRLAEVTRQEVAQSVLFGHGTFRHQ